MQGHVPASLYAPASQEEIEFQLRHEVMPASFTRRMRLLNLLSGAAIAKFEDALLLPFSVLDIHQILNLNINQDAIIDQIDNDAVKSTLVDGTLAPLADISDDYPRTLKGLQTNWLQRFIYTPFDPLCIMLAMRVKLLLDVIDEMGHSYNLMRALGFGFIDLGELTDEPPGDISDYYPPALDNPLEPPPAGEPTGADGDYTYSTTQQPGTDGYSPTGTQGGILFTPAALPDEDGYSPPEPNLPRGAGNMGGTRGFSGFPGSTGGTQRDIGDTSPSAGNPCQSVEDPTETVAIGYTSQQMSVDETQELTVLYNHPKWSYENYVWQIQSGGGTLHITGEDPPVYLPGPEEPGYDAEEVIRSFSVTYTAPSTNAECAKNPIIALICEGETVDTLSIAINAYTIEYTAYQDLVFDKITSCCVYSPYSCDYDICNSYWCGPRTYYYCNVYNCAGVLLRYCPSPNFFCHYTIPEDAWDDRVGCAAILPGGDTACGYNHTNYGVKSTRSAAKKTAGCCPAALL